MFCALSCGLSLRSVTWSWENLYSAVVEWSVLFDRTYWSTLLFKFCVSIFSWLILFITESRVLCLQTIFVEQSIISPFNSVSVCSMCFCSCCLVNIQLLGFPGGSGGKESVCNAGDPGSIAGLGRSPGEGNSNPLQYVCLENPMDRRAWWTAVHRIAKSRTRLSN